LASRLIVARCDLLLASSPPLGELDRVWPIFILSDLDRLACHRGTMIGSPSPLSAL
jgi:hypothetical protein